MTYVPQKRAQRTRTAMVTGAARVLSDDGLGAGMNAMLAVSGVTKGAAYFHFPNRQSLLAAINAEAQKRCVFVSGVTVDSTVDPVTTAGALLSTYLRAAGADPVIRADAILWSDAVHGSDARAGVHDRLRGSMLHVLSGGGYRSARRRPTEDRDRAVLTSVDGAMAILAGIGGRAGRGVGFGSIRDRRVARETIGLMLDRT